MYLYYFQIEISKVVLSWRTQNLVFKSVIFENEFFENEFFENPGGQKAGPQSTLQAKVRFFFCFQENQKHNRNYF